MKRLLFFSFMSVLLAALNSCDDKFEFPDPDEYYPDVEGALMYDEASGLYIFHLNPLANVYLHSPVKTENWGNVFYICTEPTTSGAITVSTNTLDSLIRNYKLDSRPYIIFNGALCKDRFYDGYKSETYNPKGKRIYGFEVISGLKDTIDWSIHPDVALLSDYQGSEVLSRSTVDNSANSYKNVKVFVHLLRTTSGNSDGYKKEDVTQRVVSTLNRYFESGNIHFVSAGCDDIDCLDASAVSYTNLESSATYKPIFNLKRVKDAINIFVISKYTTQGLDPALGRAEDLASNALIILANQIDKASLAHEMGHCLNLHHTHHATSYLEPDSAINSEFVDGSNAEYAGDCVADTPADPGIWNNGKYDGGNLTDAHGDRYNPDPENIMSYSGYALRKFTQGQFNRMHEALENVPKLAICIKRSIYPAASAIGSHFSQRLNLSYPTFSPNEDVTWTIKHYTDYYGAASMPAPSMDIKKGKEVTVERMGNSDYIEVTASITVAGTISTSDPWISTSGVPTQAFGTLTWTTGSGMTGTVPSGSYDEPPTVWHDIDFNLSYGDKASPYRNGMMFRVYTSTYSYYETSGYVTLSDMECSNGYIDVQVIDPCCGPSMTNFRIDVKLRYGIYALNMENGQMTIKAKLPDGQDALAEKDSEAARQLKDLEIASVKVTTLDGHSVLSRKAAQPRQSMSLSTAGWAKGDYLLEITDITGKVHKAKVGIN